MKKLFAYLLMMVLILSLTVPAFAANANGPRVVDNADLLSSDEEAALEREISNLQSELSLDIVIVTTYGTGGKSVQAYADDYYDNNGYGYGPDNSGILLLLDMDAREWYMSTCGEAIQIFSDHDLEDLGDEIVDYLSDGDYYEAFDRWLGELPSYVRDYREGDSIFSNLPLALVIGLIVAAITVLVMRSSMNTAKLQKGAVNYMAEDSFHLRQRSDVFLYSRVTRVPRPKNNGGSSTHRSSGGVSHGGRGGKF
ncbi:MAG: TPM domain-containing protein [Oscillospiraceae bacterium]|nr:TPM domain-containing protein [Oscillospiraceae bacterium]